MAWRRAVSCHSRPGRWSLSRDGDGRKVQDRVAIDRAAGSGVAQDAVSFVGFAGTRCSFLESTL